MLDGRYHSTSDGDGWEESILLVYLVSCHWLSVLGKIQKKKTTKKIQNDADGN